jgi:solute:Na+ symporter, SSS family
MQLIDWTIVICFIGLLLGVSIYANRYVKSISDFLAAGRCARRYLLAVSEGAAAYAAITLIAAWEMYYKAGFSVLWWQEILPAVTMFLALSGWVVYRYRQTRVMTMAQFFEVRYSRNFRVFGGIVAWIAGLVNYGIFPAVTARCIIYFCGIPIYTAHVGGLEVNLTVAVVMAVMLTLALLITFLGGQISVMVSDWFQGNLLNLVFLTVTIVLISQFGWSDIVETLKQSQQTDKSMLNPFKGGNVSDFNLSFFLMSAFICIYGYRAWQGVQGYQCAAKNPHEARMANILACWRDSTIRILLVSAPICAYVVMQNPKFSQLAHTIQAALSSVGNEKIQNQMTITIALRNLLPVGVIGLMATSIIAAAISSDNTCLHSWGSIFIQDVVMPFRKKRLAPEQHLRLLRYSIIGVAVFAWTFSMVFPLKEYIYMFISITGAIYVGGAGSAIIGGLYWKRGTTAGAWAGMITGSVMSLTGIIVNNIVWPFLLPQWKLSNPDITWLQNLSEKAPLNGMQMAFAAVIVAICAYIIVSLLTKPDPDFEMDKMLHRGKYTIKEDKQEITTSKGIFKLLGISSEFSRMDKFIYFSSMGMALFWIMAFIIGSILYQIFGASDDTWSQWWLFKISAIGVIAFIVTIWFLIGGIFNIIDLFRTLKTAKRSALDDGSVKSHQNVADSELLTAQGGSTVD